MMGLSKRRRGEIREDSQRGSIALEEISKCEAMIPMEVVPLTRRRRRNSIEFFP